jgi:hemoglobin
MVNKSDIAHREDLLKLVTRFYEKLLADNTINHFFTSVTHLNLDEHLPVLAEFWEMILFQTGNYRNNPMAIHLHLHEKSRMEKHHFDTWLKYFNESTDELFEGPVAENAKQRALSIATVMRIKIAGMAT